MCDGSCGLPHVLRESDYASRMTTLPSSPVSQLPPWITPTLPETTTTPSGLIVPTTPASGGLIVVRNELRTPQAAAKLVVTDTPIAGDGALDAAKQAYAELEQREGSEAAQIILGGQVELATRVRNDELREQAVKAFLAGDAKTAGELLGQLR
jgi:hypothetical protein